MESVRYTYKDSGKWQIRIGDGEYCGPWVDRFAEFEELGLDPSEVQRAYDICVDNLKFFEQYKADSMKLAQYHSRLIPRPPTKDSLADRGCPHCNAYINWDSLNEPVKDAPRFCSQWVRNSIGVRRRATTLWALSIKNWLANSGKPVSRNFIRECSVVLSMLPEA